MDWMEKLEKAVNARRDEEMPERDDDEEYDDQDGEDEEEEPQEKPEPEKKPVKKSMTPCGGKKGRYTPKPNSEDEEEAGEPDVDDPKSIEKKTKPLGSGPAKFGGKGSCGFRKALSEEAAESIDASPVLTELVKALGESHANLATLEDVSDLHAEVSGLSKGLEAVGKALTKTLSQQNELLKGIRAEVEEQGRQPAGRRSQVRKIEKGFGGEGNSAKIPARAEMLKKSMAAVKAGTIDAHSAAKLEASYNRGQFDHDLWAAING